MINSFIAESHCFVVAHNNIDDYRICELGAGNELSSLLPHFEQFDLLSLPYGSMTLNLLRPNDQSI